jgi:hypothetical protein
MELKMEDNNVKNPGEKLAWDHWKYIEGVLKAHEMNPKVLEQIKFHYTTAFIHGYKHGVEDSLSSTVKPKRN